MLWRMSGAVAAIGIAVLAAACASSGAGGREVVITQRDEGCTPVSVGVTPGEKLKLVVKNESSKDYEIEGIEGTKLEEVVVPEGRTRSPGYTVPDGGGVHKLKCYVPAGPSTIIELVAGDGTSAASPTQTASGEGNAPATPADQEQADATVAVGLSSYVITPDKPSVKAGKIRFIATNTSKDAVHELAVLKINEDGSFENMGEVEALPPEQGGTVTLDLKAGPYRLACLIAKGEDGSEADHYQQGMYTDFTVE